MLTLEKIITVWSLKYQEEKNVGVKWVEYTRSGVKSKLSGLFSSQLWKEGARGLYLRADEKEIPVEGNEQWADSVSLRGSVIICHQKKVACSGSEALHYKHAIHISKVYADLQRYAEQDPVIKEMLLHLTCNKKTVHFCPMIIVENAIEDANVIESEQISERSSEYLPPPSEDDELPPPDSFSSYSSLFSVSSKNEKMVAHVSVVDCSI